MTVPLGGVAAGMDAALTVERTTGGGVRVTCPDAPGWAAVARTPVELARALAEGWREAAVAAYAARQGERYDLAIHDQAAEEVSASGRQLPADAEERAAMLETLSCSVVPRPAEDRGAAHDPLAWSPLPDGRWVSPSGRRYRSDAQVVQRIVEKRAAMGVGVVGTPGSGLPQG